MQALFVKEKALLFAAPLPFFSGNFFFCHQFHDKLIF
jgi:hypothetical protein